MNIQNTLTLIILCITMPQAYTMEYSTTLTIFSNKSQYKPQFHTHDQLLLPHDVLDKIIAYCSPNTQCYLRETCKQFYMLTSISRLNKFVIHDFNIGEEKEKLAFFNALIKTNKPNLIPTIFEHAQKKALQLSNNNAHIVLELNDIAQQEQNYIQTSYTTPLLQEALKQGNNTMINELTRYDPDNTLVKEYYRKQCDNRCNIVGATCCGIATLGAITGFITLAVFAGIDMYICTHNITLHCID